MFVRKKDGCNSPGYVIQLFDTDVRRTIFLKKYSHKQSTAFFFVTLNQ
jgi:hypothetical protein